MDSVKDGLKRQKGRAREEKESVAEMREEDESKVKVSGEIFVLSICIWFPFEFNDVICNWFSKIFVNFEFSFISIVVEHVILLPVIWISLSVKLHVGVDNIVPVNSNIVVPSDNIIVEITKLEFSMWIFPFVDVNVEICK